jgi:hypothetical protein
MARTCSRPGCNALAAATFNFDGLRRVVWLAALDDAETRSAGDLCGRHADRLQPPRQWDLRDTRHVTDGAPSTGATAPSRYLAPPPPPPEPLPLEPVAADAQTTAIPTLPPPTPLRPVRERPAAARAEDADDETSTPMLRRAFRAANVG